MHSTGQRDPSTLSFIEESDYARLPTRRTGHAHGLKSLSTQLLYDVDDPYDIVSNS